METKTLVRGFLIVLITFFVFFSSYSFKVDKKSKYSNINSYFYDSSSLPNSIKHEFSDNLIKLENSFFAFKEALAYKESRGRYNIVSSLGYLGKYQFGTSTLALYGIHNKNYFLSNPNLQEKAFLVNLKRNKWKLDLYISKYNGKNINDVLITESGILAAAHLAGPGRVKKYLDSSGALNFKDAFGTTISSYIHNFANYDLTEISGEKYPKIIYD